MPYSEYAVKRLNYNKINIYINYVNIAYTLYVIIHVGAYTYLYTYVLCVAMQ